jgi:hypothetical protein
MRHDRDPDRQTAVVALSRTVALNKGKDRTSRMSSDRAGFHVVTPPARMAAMPRKLLWTNVRFYGSEQCSLQNRTVDLLLTMDNSTVDCCVCAGQVRHLPELAFLRVPRYAC